MPGNAEFHGCVEPIRLPTRQGRANLARSPIASRTVLLLGRPTASLDDMNRQIVVAASRKTIDRGAATVGIVRHAAAWGAVAHRTPTVHCHRDAA